ncbi:DNA sulfur modification protein DndB [Massilia sp. H6]|uniref:DNA sulfur modification protein DndB n=1 Tax=Massilia sp. H6 TaxID=2970464 RepID=UPI0021672628|nr:DNA sulfur modification protein DndB [Massilia sp. H6]UVW30703.1 DNA sulfur modification protein DndB [Massilia sp. H6]
MNGAFEYVFPSIKGVQSGREYYVSMCPLRLIPKIFLFDDDELNPELRAQRTLNKGRVPEIAEYILGNRQSYTFSAITASVDGGVRFVPATGTTHGSLLGTLHVNMQSRFIINDGQHRRAAIELALKSEPGLGDETIAVVFFVDPGLERCQQMFADLNRHAIRPSRSLGLLYDHRDLRSQLTKLIVLKSKFFCDMVEMEKNTLSERSRKLFTLSAIYSANTALLDGVDTSNTDETAQLCADYWDTVSAHIPEWQRVKEARLSAGDVRRDCIHSHSVALQAIGAVGNHVLRRPKSTWNDILNPLSTLDWSRANARTWEGRAMVGGTISKASNNVALTINQLKKHLQIPLGPDEQRTEDAFLRGHHGH